MNDIQKTYALAKAHCEAVKSAHKEGVQAFTKSKGFTMEDGNGYPSLWMVPIDYDDEEKFIQLCEEYEASEYDDEDDVREAERLLDEAEDALIEFGLSIVPAAVAETLRSKKKVVSIRNKLIDLAFRLDTKTIPGRDAQSF